LIKKLWNSPTFMTWGNLSAKSLGLILLLPLVLNKFEPADTVLWFLFFNIFAFQMLFDLGFSSSFIRIISYGVAGVEINNLDKIKDKKLNLDLGINWDTIFAIEKIMQKIYKRISFIGIVFGSVIGSLLLFTPIDASTNPVESWLSWFIVLISSFFMLYSSQYSSFLQGLGKVAVVQRWGMLSALLSIITTSMVLFFNGTLLEAIAAYQFWVIGSALLLRYLKRQIIQNHYMGTKYSDEELANVWKTVWSSAWRSGIGVFMSVGIIQLSGVIYSNLAPASKSVQYLFALQLIRAISSFSQAPFYSKIPIFSRLYASGKIEELKVLAQKSMQKSFIVYIVGFGIIGLLGDMILNILHSKSQFPNSSLWIVLSLGILVERYGAMHIQLYSVTNHIIWHKANGYSGVTMIILTFMLFPLFDIMSFALSIVIAYTFIYSPYATKFSYKEFKTSFFQFEKFAFIPALIAFVLFSILIINKG